MHDNYRKRLRVTQSVGKRTTVKRFTVSGCA